MKRKECWFCKKCNSGEVILTNEEKYPPGTEVFDCKIHGEVVWFQKDTKPCKNYDKEEMQK